MQEKYNKSDVNIPLTQLPSNKYVKTDEYREAIDHLGDRELPRGFFGTNKGERVLLQ